MGATRNNSDGMKNYYNISYGKLSAQEKTQPNNFTEITEVELKSKTQNCENLDLRNRYVFKEGKERPYIVFYDEITGAIRSIEKKEFEQGINLQIELLDSDLETSIIQSKFYSKYTENILNRLLNCDLSLNITLRPYSMPSDFDLNGQKKKYNNQGVSINQNSLKIDGFYKAESEEMPKTEVVQDANGKDAVSRVKRINFLFQKVVEKFSVITQQESQTPINEAPFPTATDFKEEEHNDMPF